MSNQDPYFGGWSDWMPTSDQTRYYRARQDETGAYHYEYAASSAVDPAVPRGEDTGLETALGNVSLTDPYSQYNYSQAYDQGAYGYAATHHGAGGAGGASASGGQAQRYDIPPPQGHSSSSRKGKGLDTGASKSKKSSRAPSNKEQEKKSSSSKRQQSSSKSKSDGVDYPQDDSPPGVPFYRRDATEYSAPGTVDVEGAAFDVGDQYEGTDYHDGGLDPTYAPAGTDYSAEEYSHEPEKPGHRSRHQPKGKHAKSSRSGKHKQSSSSHPEDPDDEAFNTAVENSDAYNPGAGGYPDEEDPGNLTPRAGSPHGDAGLYGAPSLYDAPSSSMPFHPTDSGGQYPTNAYPPHAHPVEAIQGDNGDSYDDRYVIEPSSRFEPGEVFKILWSEPRGGRDGGVEGVSEEEISHEEYESMGRKFYTGYRRFVIVANDHGHCTCVPVLTYERRACTKRGVKPEKHGIVYPQHGRPQLLAKEPGLGFEPVRLELDYQTEKLAKESRINYSKLVTVEHNVSVFFIGRIVAEDFDIVTNAVDKCWADKLRASGGGDSSRHRRRHKR